MPSQGAWWGIYPKTGPGESIGQAVARREAWAGRRFDALRLFCDMSTGGNAVMGNADHAPLARAGYRLLFSMAAKVRGGVDYTWGQVADGAADAAIHTAGRRLAALDLPVWLTTEQEFDGGSHTAEPPADYVRMWHRIFDIVVDQEGAAKVEPVWVPTGYPGNWPELESYWPGDGNVSAVGWDPYRTFPPAGTAVIDTYRFYEHLEAQPWLDTSRLYYLLAEWGVYEGSGRPAWLRGIPDSLRAKPKIKGIFYFDSPGFPQYVLDDAASQQAFADAGHDPYLTHP